MTVFGKGEEATSCNYCVVGKGGEGYVTCTSKEPNSLVEGVIGVGVAGPSILIEGYLSGLNKCT